MRDAAFILALQEPKIANLIFMDSKIILNLFERRKGRVTTPSIKLVSSNLPLHVAYSLAKGQSVERAMLEELLCFRFTRCRDLNETESIQKS